MLVSLGAALFVISALESGAKAEDVTRVAQGVAAGIGFIGGGVILKIPKSDVCAASRRQRLSGWRQPLGVTAGLGRAGAALIGLLCAWVILRFLLRVEMRFKKTTWTKPMTTCNSWKSRRRAIGAKLIKQGAT
jgi:putative Mg2+ transporter-C (MgtC) family protein